MWIPRFGLPADVAQRCALALGATALVVAARFVAFARAAPPASPAPPTSPAPPARHRSLVDLLTSERAAVLAIAAIAALLSWGYVASYLRGGPRIIDATSYWLEGRALSEGHVTWPVSDPESASLGRFLVRSETADGARAAVLFPPGYPLLLALGFLAGAPLAVGPLLAFALVLATYALAKEVARDAPDLAPVPLASAALSAVCAALRYHTADTMSHGLAALCFTLAATFLLRASSGDRSRGRSVNAALAGLFAGWLFAARPASGLACGATLLLVLFAFPPRPAPLRDRARLAALVALGALPFAIVFLAHQRLATGHWLLTTHAAAYAQNDGPPGCFRYGFGDGIGCLGEHGDFVRANLPRGFGLLPAIKTTARRLYLHLVDSANAEPLALLVPAGAALAWSRPRARALALAVLLQIAAYAPFYFDGNYPGGGARLYADVLPIEHVLLALAAARLAALAAARSSRFAALPRASGGLLAGLALLGFAFRAGFDHASLRDRDGGAPLFSPPDPATLVASAAPIAPAESTAPRSLLFVDTDAAYDLAFDPDSPARGGPEVVRWKGDVLDALVVRDRGSPPAFRARFVISDTGAPGRTVIEPYAPQLLFPPAQPFALEAESLWPPRSQAGGAFALPAFASGTCARGARALRLFRADGPEGELRVALPAKAVGGAALDVVLLLGPPSSARISTGSSAADVVVAIVADAQVLASASVALPDTGAPACAPVLRALVPSGARRVDVALSPRWPIPADPDTGPLVALDRIEVDPSP